MVSNIRATNRKVLQGVLAVLGLIPLGTGAACFIFRSGFDAWRPGSHSEYRWRIPISFCVLVRVRSDVVLAHSPSPAPDDRFSISSRRDFFLGGCRASYVMSGGGNPSSCIFGGHGAGVNRRASARSLPDVRQPSPDRPDG